jgi:hypothetical protein
MEILLEKNLREPAIAYHWVKEDYKLKQLGKWQEPKASEAE